MERILCYCRQDVSVCIWLKTEAVIRRHAELSGFPATKITEISKTIDPTTCATTVEVEYFLEAETYS